MTGTTQRSPFLVGCKVIFQKRQDSNYDKSIAKVAILNSEIKAIARLTKILRGAVGAFTAIFKDDIQHKSLETKMLLNQIEITKKECVKKITQL